MENYDHKNIEKYWQDKWKNDGLYKVEDKVEEAASAKATAGQGKNYYCLVEFTYPSGNLHVGHWYAFAVPDIFARYKRMQGYNVLYPMGFDAFGLPAENAAIKLGADPKVWTYEQMDKMRAQLRSMGAMFPWDREVVSCDPTYYKWTQWMFNQFLKNDLVYRAVTKVNWCPKDQTILANEQVIDGKCDRCGTEVVMRDQEQWMLRITKYADRLIDGLDSLKWPHSIKEAQKNWIGRSEGSELDFHLNQKGPKKAFLIHAFNSSPEKHFMPWLKAELEKDGYNVQVPKLPNPTNPNVDEQVDYIINNCSVDKDTVILGHSLGGLVAQRFLDKTNTKIKKLILVTPISEPKLNGVEDREYFHTFDWKIDFENVKNLADEIVLIRDPEDDRIPKDQIDRLSQKLNTKVFDFHPEKMHFRGEKEPLLAQFFKDSIKVFTTRADTLFGVTYVVLAPEHELIQKLKGKIENWDEVEKYILDTKKKSELDRQQSKEKIGIQLEGITAINPANGEEVPVWIADYVLVGYGTGAVMAVPAHDERDFEFAKKYNLPVKHVIAGLVNQEMGIQKRLRPSVRVVIQKGDKILLCKEKAEGIYPSHWSLPGGGIEENEDPKIAAMREIKEETGLAIKDLDLNSVIMVNYISPAHGNTTAISHYFYVKTDDELDTRLETDTERCEWMEVEDAMRLMVESHPNSDRMKMDQQITRKILTEKFMTMTADGILLYSGKFDGLTSEEARKKITEAVGGKMVKTYRLRDWGISRQRFWGTPIPIVYDPEGKAHPVPDEHLPWLLPTDVGHTPDGTAPLARSKEFLERTEKIFGKGWKPEVETMDTFVDSSWYFYRYLDPKNDNEFSAEKFRDAWMPIDLYMGGAEHTTMHLLYSRFWVKALYDLGLVKENEAYVDRRNRGLILGPDGQKMSKSRGNVVDPDEIVERLGADTVRLYLAFMGPYGVTVNYPWDPNGVVGVRRFLERVWKLQYKVSPPLQGGVAESRGGVESNPTPPPVGTSPNLGEEKIQTLLHKTIKGVTEDIAEFKFNTAISKMMILTNALEKEEKVAITSFTALLKLLSPFAPHMTEELWSNVNGQMSDVTSIHLSDWPKYDPAKIVDEEVTIVVQVNGKVRADFTVPTDSAEEDVKEKALSHDKIKPLTEGKEVKKVIYVKNKLVSIVI